VTDSAGNPLSGARIYFNVPGFGTTALGVPVTLSAADWAAFDAFDGTIPSETGNYGGVFATTDSNGDYVMNNLQGGEYMATVTYKTFAGNTDNFTVAAGTDIPNVTLVANNFAVSNGTVTDEMGEAVGTVSVTLGIQTSAEYRTTVLAGTSRR